MGTLTLTIQNTTTKKKAVRVSAAKAFLGGVIPLTVDEPKEYPPGTIMSGDMYLPLAAKGTVYPSTVTPASLAGLQVDTLIVHASTIGLVKWSVEVADIDPITSLPGTFAQVGSGTSLVGFVLLNPTSTVQITT